MDNPWAITSGRPETRTRITEEKKPPLPPPVVTELPFQICVICFHFFVLFCLNAHPPWEKGPSPRSRSPGQPAVVVLRGVLCMLHKSTGTSEISDCIRNVHPATSISKQGTLHRVKGLNNKYTHRPTTPPLPVASNHRATAPPPDSQWDCVSPASP